MQGGLYPLAAGHTPACVQPWFVEPWQALPPLDAKGTCPQNALAAILDEVKKSGIPKATSRSSIKRSRKMQLEEMTNEFGHLISYIDFEQCSPKGETAKGTVKLPFINPLAFFQHIVSDCAAFQRYYKQYLSGVGESIDSPLEVIVYNDEVSPGNQLRHDATRKMQIIYWTVKTGPRAWSRSIVVYFGGGPLQ